MGEKAYARRIAAYQVPKDMLIFSSNKNTSGIAAAAGVCHLVKLTLVHCYSPRCPVFCTGQIDLLNDDVVLTPPTSFKSLMASQILAVTQECGTAFGLLFSWLEAVLMAFNWPFPPSLPSLHRSGNQYGILPSTKYVYSSGVFWSWGNNHRMGLGTHWAHCEVDLS